MLLDPNLNSPANIDAAVHLKNDPEGWKKKARWEGGGQEAGALFLLLFFSGVCMCGCVWGVSFFVCVYFGG